MLGQVFEPRRSTEADLTASERRDYAALNAGESLVRGDRNLFWNCLTTPTKRGFACRRIPVFCQTRDI